MLKFKLVLRQCSATHFLILFVWWSEGDWPIFELLWYICHSYSFVRGSIEEHTHQWLEKGSDSCSLWDEKTVWKKWSLTESPGGQDVFCTPTGNTPSSNVAGSQCNTVWTSISDVHGYAKDASASGSVSDKPFPPVWVWMLTVEW